MNIRELSEIALFTDDVSAARRFYEVVLSASPVSEWPGGAIFAAGRVKLLVHERAAAIDGGPPNEDHFALEVAELDRTCTELQAAGLTMLVEPRDYPWGRSAYLRDPEGRLVELTQS